MKPLSLAVIHLAYRERGGEDAVVESEVRALQARGHRVTPLIFSTDDALPGRRHRLVKELKDAVVKANPDVVHVHNLFPLTMFDSHVVVGSAPVVKTLHNYRVACLAGSLMHGGQTCQRCVGRTLKTPGIVRGCYRGSRTMSLAAAALSKRDLQAAQPNAGTFICLSRHMAAMVKASVPKASTVVKPNFLTNAEAQFVSRSRSSAERSGALFVGRLSPEKGILDLAMQWDQEFDLTIAGDGPLRTEVEKASRGNERVRYVGMLAPQDVGSFLTAAAVLIFPSLWPEGHSRVLIESLAAGLPIISTGHGGIPETNLDGITGFVAPVLRQTEIKSAYETITADWQRYSSNCISRFKAEFSEDVGVARLEEIYWSEITKADLDGRNLR